MTRTEGTMTEQDAHEDKTQMLKPAQPEKKIPGHFQASLVILQGYARGMEYLIQKESTVLGRDKSADIALKDPKISRQHASILYHDGRYSLKDLNSTNGTLISGARVQQTDLSHGDKFRIGDTTLQFILQDTGTVKTFEIK
jgi:pSer/pThr/pTyr-binding forkhead associated (FHA) protein